MRRSTRFLRWIAAWGFCPVLLGAGVLTDAAPAARLLINPQDTYQLIDGFGGGIVEYDLDPAFQDPAFYDDVVFDLGLNMLRIIVDSARWKPPVDTLDAAGQVASDWLDREAMAFPMEVARQFQVRGADQIFATVFSPPRWMKTNHSGIYGGRLWPGERDTFARYLSAYVQSAAEDFDVQVGALSIQNELLFVEPYASCVYNPLQLRETLRAVQRRFDADGLDTALVVSDEMGFAERAIQYLRPIMADDELQHFRGHFSTHGWNGADNWLKWGALTAPYDRHYWMTETSGYPPTWAGALALAENMHHTLTGGQASAYIYMLVSSPQAGRFALMAGADSTPKATAFKHFSRLVRPGAERVYVGGEFAGLLVSAYRHPATGALAVVAINRGDTAVPLQLDIPGLREELGWVAITSTEDEAWREHRPQAGEAIEVPAQGVVSLYTIPGQQLVKLPDLAPEDWKAPLPGKSVDPDGGSAIDESLHRATRTNDTAEIKRLLDSGFDPNARNIGGFHPLHRASWPGHVDPIEPLIRAGADPNGKDAIGDTPLHIAAGNGHIAFMTALIAAGAEVDARNHDGATPLHRAAQAGQLATVEMLLQHGADPTLRDQMGWNALHWAAACPGGAAAKCILLLLEAGADTGAVTSQGWTPLHVAAANPIDPSSRPDDGSAFPNVPRLQLLVQAGADVNARDSSGRTPLHLAAMMGETDYFEDESGHPTIIYRTDAARYLVSAGADVTAVDSAGKLPKDYAQAEGYLDLYLLLQTEGNQAAMETTSEPSVPALEPVNGSADDLVLQQRVNARLLHASEAGDTAAVQAALKAGADPNALPFQGGGPLHVAVTGGHDGVVHLLLDAGANPLLRDSDGYTPGDRAIQVNRQDLEIILDGRAH